MKLNFILIGIILGIVLSLSLCSAQVESFGTYKQYSNVTLIQTYNASFCNITSITSPNSTVYAENTIMTKAGIKFNYTFTNTTEFGSYNVCGNCDSTAWCASLELTPSGIVVSQAQSNMSIGLLIGAALIMFFFVFLGFKLMDYEKMYPIALFFLLVSIIIALYGLYLGTVFSRDYLFTSTSGPQEKVFLGIMWGTMGMIFLALLVLMFNAVKEIKERKSLIQHGQGFNPHSKSYEY